MSNPYDAIPAGMKPILKDGEWKLVPLEAEKIDDLRVLYNEAKAELGKRITEIKGLRTEIKNLKSKK